MEDPGVLGERQAGVPPAGRRKRVGILLHAVYCARLIKEMAWEHEVIDIPKELGKSNWPFPQIEFDFLGKNLRMEGKWNNEIERDMAEGEGAYHWVKRERPDAVVVWNDEYARWRGAVIGANELGIPTIEICHGSMYLPQHGDWRSAKRSRWQFGTLNYRDWSVAMRAQGRSIITGSVEQDPYVDANVPALRATARGELNIPDGAPAVCLLTDAPFERSAWQDAGLTYHATVEMLRAAHVAQGILGGLQVVVKIHPYEKDEYGNRITPEQYEVVLGKLGFREDYVIVDDPLILALAGVDLVVGRPSSAMATALSLGIPCLVLPHAPFFPRAWFEGRGFVVGEEKNLVEDMVTVLVPGGTRMEKLIGETHAGSIYFGGRGDAATRSARAITQILRTGDCDPGDDDQSPEPHAGRGFVDGPRAD